MPERASVSAYDFENQGPFFWCAVGDTERILDNLGGFFHIFLVGVVQTAQHAARIDLPPPEGSPAVDKLTVIPVDYDYIEKETPRIKKRCRALTGPRSPT